MESATKTAKKKKARPCRDFVGYYSRWLDVPLVGSLTKGLSKVSSTMAYARHVGIIHFDPESQVCTLIDVTNSSSNPFAMTTRSYKVSLSELEKVVFVAHTDQTASQIAKRCNAWIDDQLVWNLFGSSCRDASEQVVRQCATCQCMKTPQRLNVSFLTFIGLL